ncbi:cyclin-like protein [Saccharata proteae CBS 121410]|uniref:Transcription initiation factor IIB n=1 Tax=Saccharata proteae CBS 121410 TaxID=1314787 RepID=A0A9P4LZH5_9PEZI|nr:cyclin-like protein [Saccharata proteae CBS 121410]
MQHQAAAQETEWRPNYQDTRMCPDCKEFPPNIVEEFANGDQICASCGLVVEQRIVDTRSEWRTFSNDDQNGDDPSRVGDAQNFLLDSTISSGVMVTKNDKSASARDLSRAHNKISGDNKSNRQLMNGYRAIQQYSDRWSLLPQVVESAKHLYKMVDDKRVFKGKSTDALVAGCIFIACRQAKQPRSFRELHELTQVSKKEIGRTFKLLDNFCNKENKNTATTTVGGLVLGANQYETVESTKPAELIIRHASKLNLTTRTRMLAQQLAEQMHNIGALAGRSPLSAAGACIYMVCHYMGQPRSPKEIAAAVDVSDGTIRTAYKLLYHERKKLGIEDWNEPGGDLARLPAAP